MIQAKSLRKSFGPKIAVDGITFEVKKGEVLGFLGPNGAGKSTTMRMLTGFLPMTAGSVLIDGHSMEDEPIQAKALIGYLPENAPSYPDMTVEGFLNFIASAKGLSGTQRTQAIDRVIHTCQLDKVRHQTIDTLSKGYRHRTCFAQALLSDPPVLVLDEPTDGLDPNQKHEMRKLIQEMGRSKAIIVSTHILEEVEAICTRVVIIDKGTIVFNGTPAELRAKSAAAGIVSVHLANVSFKEFSDAVRAMPEVQSTQEEAGNGRNCYRVIPRKDAREANLAAKLKDLFDHSNWAFDELHTETGRLDDVFHAITTADTAVKEAAK